MVSANNKTIDDFTRKQPRMREDIRISDPNDTRLYQSVPNSNYQNLHLVPVAIMPQDVIKLRAYDHEGVLPKNFGGSAVISAVQYDVLMTAVDKDKKVEQYKNAA